MNVNISFKDKDILKKLSQVYKDFECLKDR